MSKIMEKFENRKGSLLYSLCRHRQFKEEEMDHILKNNLEKQFSIQGDTGCLEVLTR